MSREPERNQTRSPRVVNTTTAAFRNKLSEKTRMGTNKQAEKQDTPKSLSKSSSTRFASTQKYIQLLKEKTITEMH